MDEESIFSTLMLVLLIVDMLNREGSGATMGVSEERSDATTGTSSFFPPPVSLPNPRIPLPRTSKLAPKTFPPAPIPAPIAVPGACVNMRVVAEKRDVPVRLRANNWGCHSNRTLSDPPPSAKSISTSLAEKLSNSSPANGMNPSPISLSEPSWSQSNTDALSTEPTRECFQKEEKYSLRIWKVLTSLTLPQEP